MGINGGLNGMGELFQASIDLFYGIANILSRYGIEEATFETDAEPKLIESFYTALQEEGVPFSEDNDSGNALILPDVLAKLKKIPYHYSQLS
jgi:hypothetical protein